MILPPRVPQFDRVPPFPVLLRPTVLRIALVHALLAVAVTDCAPRQAKKAPEGWVRHDEKQSGCAVFLPANWKRVSDEDARREGTNVAAGSMEFRAKHGHARVFFDDGNLEAEQEHKAEIKEQGLRACLEAWQPKEADIKEEGFEMFSQEIHEVAGGAMSETVSGGWKEIGYGGANLLCRKVILLTCDKHFTIACWADRDEFDDLDKTVFRPMLESMIVGTKDIANP